MSAIIFLLINLTIASAAPSNSVECSPRRAAGGTFLTCSDGRGGFANHYDFVASTDKVTLAIADSNGQVREVQLAGEKATEIFGKPSDPSYGYSTLLSYDQLSQPITLSSAQAAQLGIDPKNVANGSSAIYFSKVTIDGTKVLYTDTSRREVAKPVKVENTTGHCVYVGDAHVISEAKSGAPPEGICSVTVDCLDEKVGWVLRAAACKSLDGKSCPPSADICAGKNTGTLSISTVELNPNSSLAPPTIPNAKPISGPEISK